MEVHFIMSKIGDTIVEKRDGKLTKIKKITIFKVQ